MRATEKRAGAPHLQGQAERVDVFSLQKRRLYGNLISAFQYLREAYRKAGEELFIMACSNRMKRNGFKPGGG